MKTIFATVLLLFSAVVLSAQDAVKADPAHHKVLTENEYVRVLKVTLGPGEKTAVHQHPAGAALFLTGGQNRVAPVNGKADETPRKADEVVMLAPTTHTVQNIGKQPMEIIVVELKAAPAGAELTADPAKVDAKHYKVVAENDRIRVLRATYAAGDKSVMHQHPALVAVYLAPEKMRMHTPDGKSQDMPAQKRGDALIAPATTHLPENIGNGTADLMLFELKPKKG